MTTGSDLARAYDEVHYPDLCHAQTHPGRIAAVGRLLGMDPPPPERCRVLELGCAGGANLVSMALGLPDSSFVGIDLSPDQIRAAQHLAAIAGPDNVRFEAMDLLDVDACLGEFDYVIAHGVYSWVPDAVKNKVLSICRDHLSPHGLAFVSYNTMPGWSLIGAMRGIMQWGTRHVAAPLERARAARTLVTNLQELTPGDDHSALAEFLDRFANRRIGRLEHDEEWDDATLLHDELAEFNDPVWFHEFVEHAGRHGLRHLADATFPRSMTDALPLDTLARLGEMADGSVEYEQLVDFLVHRTFRRSLLCHDDVDVRPVSAAAVRRLHLAAHARLVRDDDTSQPPVQPLTVAALAHLGAVSPLAVHFDDLVETAGRQVEAGTVHEAAVDRLAADLLDMATIQSQPLLDLTTAATRLTPLPSTRPQASPLAREQARRSPYVSTLFHAQVELSGLERAIVPLLDGEHTHDEVVGALMKMLRAGQVSSAAADDVTVEQVEERLVGDVEMALRLLGRRGLLLT